MLFIGGKRKYCIWTFRLILLHCNLQRRPSMPVPRDWRTNFLCMHCAIHCTIDQGCTQAEKSFVRKNNLDSGTSSMISLEIDCSNDRKVKSIPHWDDAQYGYYRWKEPNCIFTPKTWRVSVSFMFVPPYMF